MIKNLIFQNCTFAINSLFSMQNFSQMNRLLTLIILLFFACSQKSPDHQAPDGGIQVLFKLPSKLKEVSGITLSDDGKIIWAIEDHGNKNEVYGIDKSTGKLLHKIQVDAENNDWEDLIKDSRGNLCIGDFGNNDNDRKNLAVLKLELSLPDESARVIQRTEFYYEGQTGFPPKKTDRLYDCEAFVEKGGYFYLFTKNRSKNFDGTFLVFRVPDKPGNFEAELVGRLQLKGGYNDAAVTSAALSPDGKEIVLLTHKNVYVLTGFTPDDFSGSAIRRIPLNSSTQKEAMTFEKPKTLLIADERDKSTGGNLYRFTY